MAQSPNYTAKEKISNMNSYTSNVAKEVGQEAAAVLDSARDRAERLGRDTREVVDNVVSQARDVSAQVKSEIENRPLRSSVIALGIGAVLGFLFRGNGK